MITIRRANQEDRQSIWYVHTKAIKKVCKTDYTEKELLTWLGLLTPSRYKKAIENKAVFVADNGDAILGFGQLDQHNGRIENLFVSPDYIGQGIGKKILQTLENEARDSGSNVLRLTSTLNAVPFYETAGYKSQRQSKYLLPFGMVACVYMAKKLNP
jgi:GNAT superfamily N-acetyltransferase